MLRHIFDYSQCSLTEPRPVSRAAEILDGSIRHRLAVSDRVLTFVDLVKDKYQKCVGAIASTVASQVVSYKDPVSGKQLDFKLEYGQLS